jgi:uncharacterized membrane protein YbhN (UPF0104 family)
MSRVDLAQLAARVSPAQAAAALGAGIAILSAQACLMALRLRLCARSLGYDLPRSAAWVAILYGGFFSHTPISFVGGDAMRVWHMVKHGLPLGDAAKAVFMDRALGFLGMLTLVLASAPALRAAIHDPRAWTGFVLLLALAVATGAAFVILGWVRVPAPRAKVLRWIAEFATVSRHLRDHPAVAAKAFWFAVASNALNVVAAWAIGVCYASGVDLGTAFSAAPVAFLVATVPISVAGWGLREGAFVVAFGLFGVAAEAALAISVTIGVAALAAYLPGAVLFVLARRRSNERVGYPSRSA